MGTQWAVGLLMVALVPIAGPTGAADLGEVPPYHVIEVRFAGPEQAPTDAPACIDS